MHLDVSKDVAACSGHPATHSRHWMQAAYDNVSVFRPGSAVAAWIAPVGHTRAHSSHDVQRLKSMTGKPKDGWTPKGFASVSTPVLRLLEIMRNMNATDRFRNRRD